MRGASVLINSAPGGFSLSDALVRRLAADGFAPAEEALRRWDGGRPHRKVIKARDRLMDAMHEAIGDMAAFRKAQQSLADWTRSPAAEALTYGTPSEAFAWVLAEEAKAQGLPGDLPQRVLPEIVAAAKAMGLEAASGTYCELAVVEVPDGATFTIVEEDGAEGLAVDAPGDGVEVLSASADDVARTLEHWSAEPGPSGPGLR